MFKPALPSASPPLAEHDPLRDSGPADSAALTAAGVDATLDHGRGLIHDYLRALDYCADSMATLRSMAVWLTRVTAA